MLFSKSELTKSERPAKITWVMAHPSVGGSWSTPLLHAPALPCANATVLQTAYNVKQLLQSHKIPHLEILQYTFTPVCIVNVKVNYTAGME